MRKMIHRSSRVEALVIMIAVCSLLTQSAPASAEPKASARSDIPRIHWFNGSVDAAFAQAKREHKPVLLYWGAVWCPPCLELKATVFSKPEFIEKSRLFIPVYLDGDAPDSQRVADEFNAGGYPTLIILASDRRELLRLSGGLDLSQYASALDATLEDVQPIARLLEIVAWSPSSLSARDCTRLAFNYWLDEDRKSEGIGKRADSLELARGRCPASARIDKARLSLAAAYLSPTPIRAEAVSKLLDDAEAVRLGIDLLGSLDEKFFDQVKQLDAAAQQAFLQRWVLSLSTLANDSTASPYTRLNALGAKLVAMKQLSETKSIAPDVAADAQTRVKIALAAHYGEYARAEVVDAASSVLDELGKNRESFQMLTVEMQHSKTPFFYMSQLATLEEEAGNKLQALIWLRRAYESATGPATRIQWGALYVKGLVRMTPLDEIRIRNEAMRVLAELDGPDRLHARTQAVLKSLSKALIQWNTDKHFDDILDSLREQVRVLCKRHPPSGAAMQNCNEFLANR